MLGMRLKYPFDLSESVKTEYVSYLNRHLDRIVSVADACAAEIVAVAVICQGLHPRVAVISVAESETGKEDPRVPLPGQYPRSPGRHRGDHRAVPGADIGLRRCRRQLLQ